MTAADGGARTAAEAGLEHLTAEDAERLLTERAERGGDTPLVRALRVHLPEYRRLRDLASGLDPDGPDAEPVATPRRSGAGRCPTCTAVERQHQQRGHGRYRCGWCGAEYEAADR